MARGYVDPNFPNRNGPHDATIIIYGYRPNLAICILAIILFFSATIIHSYRTIRYRAWYFLPVPFACIMECVGYISRTLSSQRDPYSVIYFVIQYFFIVVAPVFLSASIYVCLNKLIQKASVAGWIPGSSTGSILRPKPILWIFITSDVVCTIVQVAGAALIGSSESNGKSPVTANNILLAGLVVQSFAFSIFLLLLLTFKLSLDRDARFGWRWNQPFFSILALSSLLVYMRTLFRMAETSQGVFGKLSSHEVYFGCLEFAPIVVAVLLLAVWHPGKYFDSKRTARTEPESESATASQAVTEKD